MSIEDKLWELKKSKEDAAKPVFMTKQERQQAALARLEQDRNERQKAQVSLPPPQPPQPSNPSPPCLHLWSWVATWQAVHASQSSLDVSQWLCVLGGGTVQGGRLRGWMRGGEVLVCVPRKALKLVAYMSLLSWRKRGIEAGGCLCS